MSALEDLQRAVDDGHEPWRASAEDLASWCAFDRVGADVEPAGSNIYRVTDPATGQAFIVEVIQPVTQGTGGIWAATSITPVD
jgi:hypothetical protein